MRHELHLARVGFRVFLPVTGVCVVVGAISAGGRGAASAAAGAGIVGANHLVAVLSTGWAPTLRAGVMAVGYAMFVVRMLALLAAFAALAAVVWMHVGVFAGSFCASLVAMLAAECLSYARGSYVPAWRLR